MATSTTTLFQPSARLQYLPVLGLVWAALAFAHDANAADTPSSQIVGWASAAKASDAGFAPSAERGRVF